MKNYSLSETQSKNFILNYIIIGKQIIINYANNDIDVIPYSISNEKEILNKMKNQVLNSKRYSSELNNKFEIFLKLFIDEVILFILCIIAMININFTLIPSIICSIIFPIVIGLTGYKLNKYHNIRKDIKKNLLFLNNEDNLNQTIRNNHKITEGLDEKLREKIYIKETNNFSFTFNTIDNIKYRELQEIYRCVNNNINNKPNTLERKK